jgi:uncharacterized membrane protein YfcA
MSSVRAHHARGAVRWDWCAAWRPGIVLGGLLAGAGHVRLIKGQALALRLRRLRRLFGTADAARPQAAARPPDAGRGGRRRRAPASAGVGLVGAGGAFMSVPFMVWCNVPLRHAVGTSAALGFPIALASTAWAM